LIIFKISFENDHNYLQYVIKISWTLMKGYNRHVAMGAMQLSELLSVGQEALGLLAAFGELLGTMEAAREIYEAR
jgi:hypothetical protein